MRNATIQSIVALSVLSLSIVATGCGGMEPAGGEPDEDDTREAQAACSAFSITTLTQDQMNHLYFDINPTPHAEKAWFYPEEPTPQISPYKTNADANGKITVLQTTLYNRDGFRGVYYGSYATFAIHTSRYGSEKCRFTARMPARVDVQVDRGGYYWIQPLTPNTMAKILPYNLAN